MKIAQFLSQAKVDGLPSGVSGFDLSWQFEYAVKTFYAFLGAVIAFLLVPPNNVKEALIRMSTSLICSFIFGPFLLIYLPNSWVTSSTIGPIYALAGAPAWWVLGWIFNALERRRQKGIDEIYDEFGPRFGNKDKK